MVVLNRVELSPPLVYAPLFIVYFSAKLQRRLIFALRQRLLEGDAGETINQRITGDDAEVQVRKRLDVLGVGHVEDQREPQAQMADIDGFRVDVHAST